MSGLVENLNVWSARFADFALPMLVQSSLLILLLFVIDLVIRRRVRAVFRYALWLLVLVKLVLPPSFASPTGLAYWLPEKKEVRQSPAPSPQFVIRYSDIQPDEIPSLPPFSPAPPKLRFSSWLLLGWLSTVLGLTAWLVRRSRSVVLTAARATPASGSPEQLLNDCRQQLGIQRRIGLRLSDSTDSPAVCGLWRPIILIPRQLAEKLSALQLRAVLLHELAHIRRGDVAVHYAQTLLQIFYWWNPLLWFANARIRRVREQAVDDLVMVRMGGEAEAYPSTLLEVAKFAFKRPGLALGLIGIVESRSAFAQRIQHLLDRPVPKTARLGFTGFLSVCLMGAALLPMARGERKAETPAVEPQENTPAVQRERVEVTITGSEPFIYHGTNSVTVEELKTRLQRAARLNPAVALSIRADTDSPFAEIVKVMDAAKDAGVKSISAFTRAQPTNSHKSQLTNIVPSSEGQGGTKRFVLSTGQEVEIEAIKPGEIQFDPRTGVCVVTNDFVVRFKDKVLTAQRGQINTRTGEVMAEGGVTLQQGDQVLSSERVQFSFKPKDKLVLGDLPFVERRAAPAAPQVPLIDPATGNPVSVPAPKSFASQKQTNGLREVQERQGKAAELEKARPQGNNIHVVNVNVARDAPHYYLGNEPITIDRLKEVLSDAATKHPQRVLNIHADKDAPFAEIVRLHDIAREAGVPAIRAFTRSDQNPGPRTNEFEIHTDQNLQPVGARQIGIPPGALRTRLQQIVLPELFFEFIPLPLAIERLSKLAREHDADGLGINFFINPNPPGAAQRTAIVPATIDPLTGKPLTLPASEPMDMNRVIVRINPPLRNIRFADALDAIVKVADKPIQYAIEDYGVVFSPKPAGTAQLETRIFRVDPRPFEETVRKRTSGIHSTNLQELVRYFFASAGVPHSPPNAIYYNDRKGLLMVRATRQELETVERGLDVLIHSPRLVTIETSFIELTTKSAGELGLDLPPPDTTTNTWHRVITAAQMQTLLHTAGQLPGLNILSAPKITTLTGRQAQIHVGEMKSVVSGFKSEALTPPGVQSRSGVRADPYATSQTPVGPRLDVVAFVAPDGFTIHLTAIPGVTEFLGYEPIAPGTRGTSVWIDGNEEIVPLPMPIIRTRQTAATADVYDGQTLVVGNPQTTTVSRQSNGQSVINSIPEEAGKRLLVFITPTLIDPAGNPIHTPGKEPFDVNVIPAQPAR